ncbi:serine hydrolase [Rhodoferax lacus]|uniref:Serine hydrolase n=2 Tax=Rhodoferax lacus TaxID=2184758 RepID=A0A3E1RBQ8_9BURK|nr:serine hydrolase [Rhodoferax lacus]
MGLVFAVDACSQSTLPIPCPTPTAISDYWEPQSADSAGFDAVALCTVLASVQGSEANIHGVLIARNGKLVAEMYRAGQDHPINHLYGLWGQFKAFDAGTLHDVRSISKSVVSLLFGIVSAKSPTHAPNTPVIDLFPELADLRTTDAVAIQWRHLLAMSSGLDWSEGSPPDNETRLFWSSQPDRYVLSRSSVAAPGRLFNYNSGGTSLIAEALARAEGLPIQELGRQHLFDPMGITDWEWVPDLHGRALAFTGLRLRPRDLLKLGQLVLNRGQWQGRQLVPAEWIDESTRTSLSTGFINPILPDEEIGYGYQWWTGHTLWRGQRLAWIAGFGNGGQRLFVVPDLNLTMVITAGSYNARSIDAHVMRLFANVVASVECPGCR